MAQSIDIDLLIRMLKSKRGDSGLRITATEIGISAPTLSRIENGKLPDLATYSKLCIWLNVSYDYFSLGNVTSLSTHSNVVASLRADKTLAPETANSLINMINLAYNQIQNSDS